MLQAQIFEPIVELKFKVTNKCLKYVNDSYKTTDLNRDLNSRLTNQQSACNIVISHEFDHKHNHLIVVLLDIITYLNFKRWICKKRPQKLIKYFMVFFNRST